jgi:hypothetical protein
MFSKKYPVIFISQGFIDPGIVTIGKEITFDGWEALAYTPDTLPDVLKQVKAFFRKSVRIVLSEELVYVTGLSFPAGTLITRELVRQTLEENIPENLRATEWDFRTLHYVKKQKTSEILVQAAVIEEQFFRVLEQVFKAVPLPVASILPESCALSQVVANQTGVLLLVARGRESVLLCAAEDGFVIATRVKRGEISLSDVEEFLRFVAEHKLKKIQKIIFSHFAKEEMQLFQKLSADGYTLTSQDCNPLIGAALDNAIAGKDEEVLNLNAFLYDKQKRWWKFW